MLRFMAMWLLRFRVSGRVSGFCLKLEFKTGAQHERTNQGFRNILLRVYTRLQGYLSLNRLNPKP